jgi:thioredoxin reductase
MCVRHHVSARSLVQGRANSISLSPAASASALRGRLEEAVSAGGLDILWNTNLLRIDPDSVTYRNGGPPETLPNDYTFIFAGGELPTRFLRDCGVEIETRFGRP